MYEKSKHCLWIDGLDAKGMFSSTYFLNLLLILIEICVGLLGFDDDFTFK